MCHVVICIGDYSVKELRDVLIVFMFHFDSRHASFFGCLFCIYDKIHALNPYLFEFNSDSSGVQFPKLDLHLNKDGISSIATGNKVQNIQNGISSSDIEVFKE